MTAIEKLYLKLIQKGEKTIDDIPESIREKIEKILNEYNSEILNDGEEVI